MKIEFDTMTVQPMELRLIKHIVDTLLDELDEPIPYTTTAPGPLEVLATAMTSGQDVDIIRGDEKIGTMTTADEPETPTRETTELPPPPEPVEEPPPPKREAPKKAAEPKAVDELTLDDVRDLATATAKSKGRDKVRDVLKAYGAQRIDELDSGDYPAFMSDLRAVK